MVHWPELLAQLTIACSVSTHKNEATGTNGKRCITISKKGTVSVDLKADKTNKICLETILYLFRGMCRTTLGARKGPPVPWLTSSLVLVE